MIEDNRGVSSRETSVRVGEVWRLDFGVDLVATTLTDRNYFGPKVQVPDGKGGMREARLTARGVADSLKLGPAAFGHYYWDTGTGCGIGPALGIAATSPVRYLAGLGLSVGTKNRISIIGGAAFGDVNRLNGDIPGLELNGGEVSLKPVMRNGLFISAMFSARN